MFVYADESGHTGRYIFNAPSRYRVGALLSVQDIEEGVRAVIEPSNIAAGRNRLHANELGPHAAAALAPSILDALDAAGTWTFFFEEMEKDYIATTKFVDTIFDSGENQAVPAMWYNVRGFRHVLCLAMDEAMGDRHRRAFWSAYLDDDIEAIGEVVRKVGHFIRMRHPDRRLREIVRDAFDYVLRHPSDFTLSASRGRRAYQGHTPNIIGFIGIFDAIHEFVDRTGSRPIGFVHDQQSEFGPTMREWAEVFGRIRRHERRGIAEVDFADYDLPRLSLPSSADVFGLQAVDLLLWIMTRNDEVLQPVQTRLESNVRTFGITRETSAHMVYEFNMQNSRPLTALEEAMARERRDAWEADRQTRIAERRRT